MESRDTQWRVAYVRHLGEKQRGLGPRDNFQFFEDLGNLKADYCAFLEYKEYGDDYWTIFARIFVGTIYKDYVGISSNSRLEATNYVLVNSEGEKITNMGLKRGILSDYLKIHHPTSDQFLKTIQPPKG